MYLGVLTCTKYHSKERIYSISFTAYVCVVCECVCQNQVPWISRLSGFVCVYSALFVGGIYRRQTAIDQSSQGEQRTKPCLSMVY